MLMLLLLFKQRQAIRILLDMLTSRKVLTDDDEQAFTSVLNQDTIVNAEIFEEARAAYLAIAHQLGVETGLEKQPKLPSTWFRGPN